MRRIPAPQTLAPVRAGVAVSGARLVSALRADSLDRALVAGRDPTCSHALTLRAARSDLDAPPLPAGRRNRAARDLRHGAEEVGGRRLGGCGVGQPRPPHGPGSAAAGWRPAVRPGWPTSGCCSPTRPAPPTWAMPPALAGALNITGCALAGHPTAPRVVPTRAGDPGREHQASGSHLLLDGPWVTRAGRRRERRRRQQQSQPAVALATRPEARAFGSASLNGEVARQREIETRRTMPNSAPRSWLPSGPAQPAARGSRLGPARWPPFADGPRGCSTRSHAPLDGRRGAPDGHPGRADRADRLHPQGRLGGARRPPGTVFLAPAAR